MQARSTGYSAGHADRATSSSLPGAWLCRGWGESGSGLQLRHALALTCDLHCNAAFNTAEIKAGTGDGGEEGKRTETDPAWSTLPP